MISDVWLTAAELAERLDMSEAEVARLLTAAGTITYDDRSEKRFLREQALKVLPPISGAKLMDELRAFIEEDHDASSK